MWELEEMVVHVPDLNSMEAFCLHRLANRADTKRECRYAINTLAKELRVGRRDVFYLLRALEEMGLIERSHEPGKALKIKVLIEDVLPGRVKPVERDQWGHAIRSKRGYEKFHEKVHKGRAKGKEKANHRPPIALYPTVNEST